MDYEKAYKDALAKAREIHRNEDGKRFDMEWLFPELKESEDEKLRKQIIQHIKQGKGYDLIPEGCYEPWITWLEKQGEQKPKDIYTFKSIPRLLEMIKPTDRAKRYCQKLIDSLLQEGYVTDAKIVSDCLKQMNGEKVAMATMDEQKPVDKVEPFDKYEGLTDFERTLADICIGWIGKELGWKQYIKDNADVLLKIAIKMFNSIQDAPFEQKSAAWSDEDEHRVEDTIYYLDTAKKHYASTIELDACIDWLKSLKDRIGG